MTRRARSATGASVAELLAAVAIGSLLIAVATPAVGTVRDRIAVRTAARVVAASFREAAASARRQQRAVGWEVDARRGMRLIADRDADGLRRDDVDGGIDVELAGWRPFGGDAGPVEAAVGCTCPSIDGAGSLTLGESGVRFGPSRFVSFSPAGSSSSGTLYLALRAGPALAVRVLGTTGRVRVFEFVEGRQRWVER